jgi:serine/threonine-protein kinase
MDSLGPFELRGELGRGAMAVVWRGWDRQLEREVAIKEPVEEADKVLKEMKAAGYKAAYVKQSGERL